MLEQSIPIFATSLLSLELTFQGCSLSESKPFQAAVGFSQTEEDAVGILSSSTEQERGRRQL